jgi:benzoyl-CoA reductase/2-hydroxyglutaryl-CoA dehydratase subunit BcrC/BadD/HgdB
MPLAHPALSAVLRDPLCAARESGRPIVAFASNNVPVELIHAAGCFPLQLPTAPRPDTARADRYLESRFEPMTRAALELMLAGELDAARLVVLPRTSDSWQRLYYYLCELARSFGEQLPEPFLYDLLHTPFESSAEYNLESTRALAEKLAAVSGKRPSEPELAQSIALYNRIRDKLNQCLARRRAVPCQLAGSDAVELFTASQRLDPLVFEGVLEGLMASPTAAVSGMRTLLIGSAHDTPALHRAVERAGGQVVADYHFRGDLLWGPKIAHARKPIEAIAQHYHRSSLSARTFPTPLESLVELAKTSRADAAIFYYYAEEEALTWDYAAQEAALRALGISTLHFESESYPPSAAVEPRLRDFFSKRRT